MRIRSLPQSIFLATVLLCRLKGQTAVNGNQIHLAAKLHTASSYAVVPGDCGNLLSFSASSAIAITIPSATVALLAPGCWMDFQNSGSGVATITPSGVAIDGVSTAVLSVGEGLHMVFTGSAFLTVRGGGGGSVWTNIVIGSSSTPVFSAAGMFGLTFLYSLTGDVPSSTLTAPAAGVYIFAITQDGSGGHAFAWPQNVTNAPTVDPGPNDTTYLLCQFDGTNCVGIANFAVGVNVTPGITIPGLISGSNTIAPPAAAGTDSRTNLAPNGTTVIPNACTGGVVQSIGADGIISCGTGGGSSGGSSSVTDFQSETSPVPMTGTDQTIYTGANPVKLLAGQCLSIDVAVAGTASAGTVKVFADSTLIHTIYSSGSLGISEVFEYCNLPGSTTVQRRFTPGVNVYYGTGGVLGNSGITSSDGAISTPSAVTWGATTHTLSLTVNAGSGTVSGLWWKVKQ